MDTKIKIANDGGLIARGHSPYGKCINIGRYFNNDKTVENEENKNKAFFIASLQFDEKENKLVLELIDKNIEDFGVEIRHRKDVC